MANLIIWKKLSVWMRVQGGICVPADAPQRLRDAGHRTIKPAVSSRLAFRVRRKDRQKGDVYITTQTQNNTEEIRQIKQQVNDLAVVINDFTDNNIKKEYLFYNDQTVEANIAYSEIYSFVENL